MRHTRALLVLPLLLLPAGCIAAAGAGAGALVAHEIAANNPTVAHVQIDVDDVWPTTLETLRDLGATELEVQDYPRVVEGQVWGGQVRVKVEAYDIDHTIVRLQFRKHGMIDNTSGEELLEKLMGRYASRT